MWTRFRRSAAAFLRLASQLHRIQALLEEQNSLMRELHIALTGRQPSTPRHRSLVENPVVPKARPVTRRSGHDVWLSTPLSETAQRESERRSREMQASAPVETSVAESMRPSAADGPRTS